MPRGIIKGSVMMLQGCRRASEGKIFDQLRNGIRKRHKSLSADIGARQPGDAFMAHWQSARTRQPASDAGALWSGASLPALRRVLERKNCAVLAHHHTPARGKFCKLQHRFRKLVCIAGVDKSAIVAILHEVH